MPLFGILKLNNNDTRFMLRKLLFPLEYLIQVKSEKAFNNSRSATRLIHVVIWLMSASGLLIAIVPLILLNEPLEAHMGILWFITYYCMVAPIPFWFQPHANISTKTK